MPGEVWDAAEPPRWELMPRTGQESGIPAVCWKHPSHAHTSCLVRASSKYVRAEEVRRRACVPCLHHAHGFGGGDDPSPLSIGLPSREAPSGTSPAPGLHHPSSKFECREQHGQRTFSAAAWHRGPSLQRPVARLLGKAADPSRRRSAAQV